MGQHYLIDGSVVKNVLDLAAVRRQEKVLEIGTGRGALTRQLVRRTDRLEGYEVDKESFCELERELCHVPSFRLRNEDVFKSNREFDVLVSSLPYSESSDFIEWLSHQRYDRAVVLLQEDFVRKITAKPGENTYRAISVIAQASCHIEVAAKVGRNSFDPPPRVDSSLTLMQSKRTLTPDQTAMMKKIFSQKGRTLTAALKTLNLNPRGVDGLDRNVRVGNLNPEEVILLLKRIADSPVPALTPGRNRN